MSITRGIKCRFVEGEKVLCYEPDPTKAKVLYDSKVLEVEETKDNRGRLVRYKIHFQGWNSSWDRKVAADFVLKDTEENRQLQRELAEKAQLQLAAYLYRKERNKKRARKDNSSERSPKSRTRVSSEDGSSCSTLEKNDSESMMTREDCDSDSCTSTESAFDEDRVHLNMSTKLKQYLDFDHEMIKKCKRQHILPAQIPAVTILENFVKQSIIKMVTCSSQSDATRRRGSQLRTDKKDKGFDKIEAKFGLLKEVADGLRIYLNFILVDHLLYNEEKHQAEILLSEESLQNFSYVASDRLSFEYLQTKFEEAGTPPSSENSDALQPPAPSDVIEEVSRRRLRSYRNEENEGTIELNNTRPETCLSSVASTSSGGSTPHANVVSANLALMPTINSGIPSRTKDFLQEVISWQLLPSNAAPEASMIFGAVHLTRLLVKLPDFLNASAMSDQKLEVLTQHLDAFLKYLESHKDWFGEQNYYKEQDHY